MNFGPLRFNETVAGDSTRGQKAVRRAPGSTQGELLEGIGESWARQGGGAGQGPEVGKGLRQLSPLRQKGSHTRPHFLTTVPQNGQVGVWEIVFVSRAGPRSISKRAIIDERGIKISEEVIYFCDSGSPFSEKMCQNCCKGCQILTSRSLLPRSSEILRMLPELVREMRPGTYLPHAPGVRMT